MKELDERIIKELKLYEEPVRYSDFREKFADPNFLDRLCFLISTGDVVIAAYCCEGSRYPEEVKKIYKVMAQIDPLLRAEDVEGETMRVGKITLPSRKWDEQAEDDTERELMEELELTGLVRRGKPLPDVEKYDPALLCASLEDAFLSSIASGKMKGKYLLAKGDKES